MPFLYRVVALLAVLTPLFAAPADAQAPERRFALVIGNSEYKAGRHPTAANDAGLVAETLRTAGFDVAGARDLDQDTLRRSAREFLDKVSAAGPQAVAFIYIAGYGLQFEGENYIVPVDATIARDEDIPIEAVRISDITRPMSGMPGGVKLVVVDAARQHPYLPAGTPLASGLALIDPDPATLIAFNTAPGAVAPIENGPYGAFAQALAEMIGAGGIGLDDVFARVRLRVNEKTGGVAVPWYASKVTQAFLFTERTVDAPPAPQAVVTTMELQSTPIQQFQGDQDAYVAALERDTISGYEEFIAAFPDSVHIRRIRALIAVRREAILWRRVFSLNTQEAYWSYLDRYPQGGHVADVERRLARLAAAYDPPPAFVPMAFDDVPPPPPDEVVYLTQPQIVFDDPVFVAPPPMPAFFCPPPPPEFIALPPPPPPIGAFFLPAPVVSFFSGPRPWVRPPAFVQPPPRAPVQQITVNNTTIVNERPAGGAVGLMSPTLPGAVVARVNSGVLQAPPPAPPVRMPPPQVAAAHPGVGVLGTQVPPPQRVHAVALPGGPTSQPGVVAPAAGPRTPGGIPQRPALPNTATTTPGGRQQRLPNTAVTPPPVGPGGPGAAPGRSPGIPAPGIPATASTTPGVTPPAATPGPGLGPRQRGRTPQGPATATTTPAAARPSAAPAPQGSRPAALPPAAPAHVTPPPPAQTHVAAPPPPARVAPPPPAPAVHTAPPVTQNPPPPPAPRVAAPAPPPARPAPPPPPAVRAPPPVTHNPPPPPAPRVAAPTPPPARPASPPPAGRKCEVVNGQQVCR